MLYYRRRGKEVRSDENLNLGFSSKSLGERIEDFELGASKKSNDPIKGSKV